MFKENIEASLPNILVVGEIPVHNKYAVAKEYGHNKFGNENLPK